MWPCSLLSSLGYHVKETHCELQAFVSENSICVLANGCIWKQAEYWFFWALIPLAQHKSHTTQCKCSLQEALGTSLFLCKSAIPKGHGSLVNASMRVCCPVGKGMSSLHCLWGISPLHADRIIRQFGLAKTMGASSLTSAPSRLSCGARQGCSGLHPARSRASKNGDVPICFLPVSQSPLSSGFISVAPDERCVFPLLLGWLGWG